MLPFIETPRTRAAEKIGQGIATGIGNAYDTSRRRDLINDILNQNARSLGVDSLDQVPPEQRGDLLQNIIQSALTDPRVLADPQMQALFKEPSSFFLQREEIGQKRIAAQAKALEERQKQLQAEADLQAINQERARRGLEPLPTNISPATARSLTEPQPFESTGIKRASEFVNDQFESDFKAGKAAERQMAALNRIKELSSKNNKGWDNTKAILRRFGVTIPESADDAQIAQANTEFWSNLRDSVGAIRFKVEFDNFTNRLPDLMQRPETRLAVINSMEKATQAAKIRGQAAKNVRTRNRGLVPIDYDVQVEEEFQRLGGEQLADEAAESLNILFQPQGTGRPTREQLLLEARKRGLTG